MSKYARATALSAAGVLCIMAQAAEADWQYEEPACDAEYSAPNFQDKLLWELVRPALPQADQTQTLAKLRRKIDKCKAVQTDPIEKQRLEACFARPIAYLTWMRNLDPAYALGLAVDPAADPLVPLSNDDYYQRYGPDGHGQERDQLSIPACLRDVEVLKVLNGVNLGLTPGGTDNKLAQAANGVADAEEVITRRCPGAIVLPYVTSQTQSLDRGADENDRHGRLIVAYKPDGDTGEEISHYVQFTVNTNPKDRSVRSQASVVNVIPEARGVAGAHVFDWQRNHYKSEFVYSKKFGNDQKCYQCHMSGMLEIHPFGTGVPDVMSVGDTLGAGWEARTDALNLAWDENLRAINKRVRDEYKARTSILHGLRADVITSPALSDFPELLRLVATSKAWGRPTELAGSFACRKLIEELAQETGTPKGMQRCSACHAQRGAVVQDAWTPEVGWMPLMTKYTFSGMMPPNHPAWRNGKVVTNTMLDPKDQRFVELGQCLIGHAQSEIYTWMSNWVPGCEML